MSVLDQSKSNASVLDQSKPNLSELDQPEPIDDVRVVDQSEPIADESVLDQSEPMYDGSVSDHSEPIYDKSVSDQSEPIVDENVLDQSEPIEYESVLDQSEPIDNESVLDQSGPIYAKSVSDQSEPTDDQSVSDQSEPIDDLSVLYQLEPIVDDIVLDQSEPIDDVSVLDQSEPIDDESGLDQSEPIDDESVLYQSETKYAESVLGPSLPKYDKSVLDQSEPIYDKSVSDQSEPIDNESVLGQSELLDDVSVLDQSEPIGDERVLDRSEPIFDKSVSDQSKTTANKSVLDPSKPIDDVSVLDQLKSIDDVSLLDQSEPKYDESVLDPSEPIRDESVLDQWVSIYDESGLDQSEPIDDVSVLDQSEPKYDESVLNQSGPIGDESVLDQLVSILDVSVLDQSEQIDDVSVLDQSDPIDDESVSDQSEPITVPTKHLTSLVEDIIHNRRNVNMQDVYGNTVLHYAVGKDNVEILDVLVNHRSIDFTLKNKKGFNALHNAAWHGNSIAAEKILGQCPQLADIKNDDGDTALHLSCLHGYRDVTCALITLGLADTNIRNNQQQTPLLLAESKGHTSLIEPLVSKDMIGGFWDRGGCFHSHGGTLTKDESSVTLIIPPGAVEHTSFISGKVFTDLQRFKAIFKLSDHERIVSPIAEFKEHNNVTFSLHVTVKIPTPYSNLSDGRFSVLSISNDGQVMAVPLTNSSEEKKPEVYYNVSDGAICIFTKHFTGFNVICENNILYIQACLFGIVIQNFGSRSDVKMRLHVFDSVYTTSDFKVGEKLRTREKCNGLECWEEKQIHVSQHDECDTICSHIDFYPSEKDWKVATRPDGSCLHENREKEICSLLKCAFPILLGEWELFSSNVHAPLQCLIGVRHIHNEDLRTCDTFRVSKFINEHTDKLVDAAAEGRTSVVCKLLKQFPDTVDQTSLNQTALQAAIRWDHKDCVQLLMDARGNIELQDNDGDTALHYSARWGRPQIMQLLLQSKSNIDAQNKSGWSSLHHAVYRQHLECAKLIIKNKCNVNLQDDFGDTALHFAFANENEEIIEAIINHCHIDFTLKDKRGFTALHHAVFNGNNLATEKILVRCPQLADIKNDDGNTPLHLSCLRGYKDVACTLITLGQADTEILNNQQQTPLLLAQDKGHTSLIKLLVNKAIENSRQLEPGGSLMDACPKGQIGVVKEFPDIVDKTRSGQTALPASIPHGHKETEPSSQELHDEMATKARRNQPEIIEILPQLNSSIDAYDTDDMCDMDHSLPIDDVSVLDESKPNVRVFDQSEPIVSVLDQLEPIYDESVFDQSESIGDDSVLDQSKPICDGSLLDQSKPTYSESVLDQFIYGESVLDQTAPIDDESVLDQSELINHVSVLDQLKPIDDVSVLDQSEPIVDESVLDQSESIDAERVLHQSESIYVDSVLDQSDPIYDKSVSDQSEPITVSSKHLTSLVEDIIHNKRNVNMQDAYGNTALHYAVEKDNIEIIEVLVNHRSIDFTLKNKKGFNALHNAAWHGNNIATEKILGRCPRLVDIKNNEGDTPLHLSCLRGYRGVTCTLITLGHVDTDILNNQQQTPVLLAKNQGHISLIEPLESKNMIGGKWDRGGCFHSHGGTLTKHESSVELIIPPDAVEKTSIAYISGKVFTDLKRFKAIFKLSDHKRIVSPIAEFKKHNQVTFSLHVTVKIPTPYSYLSGRKFSVWSISNDGQVKAVPPTNLSEVKNPDVYYEVSDGAISILTKHFTGYCVAGNECDLDVQACLFGLRFRHFGGRSDVKIRFYLFDSVYTSEDFKTRQTLHTQEKGNGLECWEEKPIHVGNHHAYDTICSHIEFYPSEKDWEKATRPDGSCLHENRGKNVCSIHIKPYPILLGEWELFSSTVQAPLQCLIDVLHKHKTTQHRCDTLRVSKFIKGQIQEQTDNPYEEKIQTMHKSLYRKIGQQLPHSSQALDEFKREIPLEPRDKEECKSAEDLLETWESKGGISLGNYVKLLELLKRVELIAIHDMAKTLTDQIQELLLGIAANPAKPKLQLQDDNDTGASPAETKQQLHGDDGTDASPAQLQVENGTGASPAEKHFRSHIETDITIHSAQIKIGSPVGSGVTASPAERVWNDDQSPRVYELTEDSCDFDTLGNICNRKTSASHLRSEASQSYLNVQGEINSLSAFHMDNQRKIRDDCVTLVDKLGIVDDTKTYIVSGLQSIITFYCKSCHKEYQSNNGWLDVLQPLLPLQLTRTQLYHRFYGVMTKYIPSNVESDCLPGEINSMSAFHMDNQQKIRDDCVTLVDKLGIVDDTKTYIVSDLQSIITFYCKSCHKEYKSNNGWLDVLQPLLPLQLTRTQLYHRFCDKMTKCIPISVD